MNQTIRMMRTSAVLIVALMGCAGTFNGVSFDRRGRLEQTGFQVRELRGGWVRLVAPEGYSFVMPSAPSVEEESVQFAGASIPLRHFEIRAEQNSRGYLVRVFDMRELGVAARDALQNQATALFIPPDSDVQSRRRLRPHGLDVELTVLDGFGTTGRHMGVLQSFQENGFVWFMMAIYEDGGGGPGIADSFFARRY